MWIFLFMTMYDKKDRDEAESHVEKFWYLTLVTIERDYYFARAALNMMHILSLLTPVR